MPPIKLFYGYSFTHKEHKKRAVPRSQSSNNSSINLLILSCCRCVASLSTLASKTITSPSLASSGNKVLGRWYILPSYSSTANCPSNRSIIILISIHSICNAPAGKRLICPVTFQIVGSSQNTDHPLGVSVNYNITHQIGSQDFHSKGL